MVIWCQSLWLLEPLFLDSTGFDLRCCEASRGSFTEEALWKFGFLPWELRGGEKNIGLIFLFFHSPHKNDGTLFQMIWHEIHKSSTVGHGNFINQLNQQQNQLKKWTNELNMNIFSPGTSINPGSASRSAQSGGNGFEGPAQASSVGFNCACCCFPFFCW